MPEPDDLVARIEALNGRPLENRPDPKAELEGVRRKLRKGAKAPEPVVMRRDLPQTTRRADAGGAGGEAGAVGGGDRGGRA